MPIGLTSLTTTTCNFADGNLNGNLIGITFERTLKVIATVESNFCISADGTTYTDQSVKLNSNV